MINMASIPQDCSAETLFEEPKRLLRYPPDLYALQYAGPMGYLKIDVWAIALDPCEFNTRKPDGTIDHDNYICLCKFLDGSSVSVRYRKTDLRRYYEEKPFSRY